MLKFKCYLTLLVTSSQLFSAHQSLPHYLLFFMLHHLTPDTTFWDKWEYFISVGTPPTHHTSVFEKPQEWFLHLIEVVWLETCCVTKSIHDICTSLSMYVRANRHKFTPGTAEQSLEKLWPDINSHSSNAGVG